MCHYLLTIHVYFGLLGSDITIVKCYSYITKKLIFRFIIKKFYRLGTFFSLDLVCSPYYGLTNFGTDV